MTSKRLPLLLSGLVLVLLLGGGLALGLLFGLPHGGDRLPAASPPPLPEMDAWSAVCLGRVDVEGGVLSLAPDQAGRVVEVPAREEESYARGAVLLRQDDGAARSRLEQARGALQAAEAQLAGARTNLEQHPLQVAQARAAVEAATHRLAAARQLAQRQRHLLRDSLANSWEAAAADEQVKELTALVEESTDRLKGLEQSEPAPAVQEAQARVAECQAAVRQADDALRRYTLRAPEAGTVLRVLVGPGEMAGGPNGKTGILFCPDRPLLIRAEVEQEFAGRVAVGQPARVEDEFNPAVRWTGRVQRLAGWYSPRRTILGQPGEFKDVPTVECLIALDRGSPPFRLGQRVRVKIGGGQTP